MNEGEMIISRNAEIEDQVGRSLANFFAFARDKVSEIEKKEGVEMITIKETGTSVEISINLKVIG